MAAAAGCCLLCSGLLLSRTFDSMDKAKLGGCTIEWVALVSQNFKGEAGSVITATSELSVELSLLLLIFSGCELCIILGVCNLPPSPYYSRTEGKEKESCWDYLTSSP